MKWISPNAICLIGCGVFTLTVGFLGENNDTLLGYAALMLGIGFFMLCVDLKDRNER